ncbi:MAG: TolC family protein, partial [Gemmatimonadaceae bacterium]
MTPTTSTRASRQTLHGLFILAFAWPHLVAAQVAAEPRAASQAPLSVEAAVAAARLSSADLAAARAAVQAARGRERQAAAITNPAFSYATEKTAGGGLSNRQHIAALEQPIELGGQRGARRDAARSRREAEEANLALAESNLRYDVTLTFAKAAAINRRAALALEAAREFERAVAISAERMASGDISGYAHRRLRLEATRYAVLSAEANLERAAARRALASLMGMTVEALPPLPDSIPAL